MIAFTRNITNGSFAGRTSRREFWKFALQVFILWNALALAMASWVTWQGDLPYLLRIVLTAYVFIALLPTLAIGSRRAHDVGMSGWIILAPIFNIVIWCQAGEDFTNEHGDPPTI